MPFLIVTLTGEDPGVWHHESAEEDHRTFMSAMLPSDIIPRGSSSSNIVVPGFLVTATKLAMGSTPNLCVTKLPINGSEVIGQFGLKSVAMENGQSSEMHFFIGNSRLFPRT